jgi:hypothetical protein
MISLRKTKHQMFIEELKVLAEENGLPVTFVDGRDDKIRGMSFDYIFIDECDGFEEITCLSIDV